MRWVNERDLVDRRDFTAMKPGNRGHVSQNGPIDNRLRRRGGQL